MLANDFTTNGKVNIAIYNDYATITFISIHIFIFISQFAIGSCCNWIWSYNNTWVHITPSDGNIIGQLVH